MTKKLKMEIGLVLASSILLAGVIIFNSAGIRRSINHIRSERLFAQAQEAFDAEAWGDAVQKGRAAHYLNPEDQDIQLIVARALLNQRNINTVEWWKRVLTKPDLPVDDLRKVTQTLLLARMYDEAIPFLERLVEMDSDNPETQNLWLGALQARRNISGTRSLATELVEEGSEDWMIHQRYMQLQQTLPGESGANKMIDHLKSLIAKKGELGVLASRELILLQNATTEDRLMAAEFLVQNSEDGLDLLMAQGIRVKEGVQDESILSSLLDDYLASDLENKNAQALGWALWNGVPELYLSRVNWEDYTGAGGPADLYLQALMQIKHYRELIDITEANYRETNPESIIFLAYRAAAQRQLGLADEADATLRHAVQVVNPSQSVPLEKFLLTEGQWTLLVELYSTLLRDDPENANLLYRYFAALYYTGQQEKLADRLAKTDLDLFENQIGSASFVAYLKLIVLKWDPILHESLETLMSQYPEVYDFRLIVGLSYLLQGKVDMARSFADNMPELSLNAPRHLRVCAALLTNSSKDRFSSGELDYLMPRERYLLSLIPQQ